MSHQISAQHSMVMPQPQIPDLRPEDLRTVEALVARLAQIIGYLEEQQQMIANMRMELARRINEMIVTAPATERPSAGIQSRIFWDTTANIMQFDDGTQWRNV